MLSLVSVLFSQRILPVSTLAASVIVSGLCLVSGCGGGDSGDPAATGGTGATGAIGGAGTAGTGGIATGGSNTGGATAGTGATTGTGATAGTDNGLGGSESFWAAPTYTAPNPVPTLPTGAAHYPGQACQTCHSTTTAAAVGGSVVLLYGGTIYAADGSGAPGVEIGVKEGSTFKSTYSATDGSFWVLDDGSTTINWLKADVRTRNATAEDNHATDPSGADCNSCHVAGGTAVPIPVPTP